MGSTAWSYIIFYFTYFMLIQVPEGVPLSGKNVRDSKPDEFPFAVSIQRISDKYHPFCVGTLISQKHVLTAEHCLNDEDISDISILVGSIDLRQGKRYSLKFWISYDQWTNETEELRTTEHDIAVITLKQKVKEVASIAMLIFVPEKLTCQKLRVVSWDCSENENRSLILQTAVVKVISKKDCKAKIQSFWPEPINFPQNIFCTLADPWVLGDCGDSGAPILNKHNQVVGIHRGIGPQNLDDSDLPREFVHQNLVNLHLHLYPYRQFINDIILRT